MHQWHMAARCLSLWPYYPSLGQLMLAPLATIALKISQVHHRTGRSGPSVITWFLLYVTPSLWCPFCFLSRFLYKLSFNSKCSCTTCSSLHLRLQYIQWFSLYHIKLLFIFGSWVAYVSFSYNTRQTACSGLVNVFNSMHFSLLLSAVVPIVV